jgi:TolB-like protein
MTRKDSTGSAAGTGEAARRFVSVDAGEQGADGALASWLAERPEHERALERVELAVALGKRLAAEPGSALYLEAAAAARIELRRRLLRRALAWGGALAAAVLLAVVLLPDSAPRSGAPELTPLRAAQRATVDAPSDAVAVLPTGVVVDAGAVAVLPFAASGDATLAAGLERDVAASLRTVPGLYVIADDAVQPYAATQLDAAEIGAQLGARGIVDGAVDLVAGRLRVSARLREAATGATLWQIDVDRPIDELGTVRYEIAENVAAAMLDSGFREQAARAGRSSAPVSVGKPLPQ